MKNRQIGGLGGVEIEDYAKLIIRDGKVYHYRDSSGLEIDAIVELPNETWAAFEKKFFKTCCTYRKKLYLCTSKI